jgi:hypothetical protein
LGIAIIGVEIWKGFKEGGSARSEVRGQIAEVNPVTQLVAILRFSLLQSDLSPLTSLCHTIGSCKVRLGR